MSGMWLAGMSAIDHVGTARPSNEGLELRGEVKELQRQVERLALMNQALWELLRERLGVSDADLEAVAHEVDMRDGIADDKMTAQAVRCPSCGRVNNSRHAKCLYCGQLFEKPLFG